MNAKDGTLFVGENCAGLSADSAAADADKYFVFPELTIIPPYKFEGPVCLPC